MTRMTGPQRRAILNQHRSSSIGAALIANTRTVAVLVREGWATYSERSSAKLRRYYKERSAYVTREGLIAAGVDFGALHADALAENARRVPD